MRVGDRVIVAANWSSFYRQRGVVTQLRPHLMVRVDGDQYPMRFGDREVSVDESEHAMVAGD